MSSLSDLIPKFGHFFHLNVTLGSFVQLVHATGVFFFAQLPMNLLSRRARSMEYNATSVLRFQIWTVVRQNLYMNFLRDSLSACPTLAKAVEVMR